MIRFTVRTEGLEQMGFALSRFGQDLSDWRRAWPMVSRAIERIEERLFAGEGSKGHRGKWAALSPKYAAWKSKHYPGQAILRLTDAMYDSLTKAGASMAVVEVSDPLKMFRGTEVPYAKFHQSGTEKMPARHPVDLTERDQLEIAKEIHQYVVKQADDRFKSTARGKFSMAMGG